MGTQEEGNQGGSATFTPSYDSRTDTWNYDRCALDIAVLSLGMDARYAHRRAEVLVCLQQSQNDAQPLQAKALALVQEIGAQVDECWADFAKRMRGKIMQTVPDHECTSVCQIIEQATQASGANVKGEEYEPYRCQGNPAFLMYERAFERGCLSGQTPGRRERKMTHLPQIGRLCGSTFAGFYPRSTEEERQHAAQTDAELLVGNPELGATKAIAPWRVRMKPRQDLMDEYLSQCLDQKQLFRLFNRLSRLIDQCQNPIFDPTIGTGRCP